MYEWEQHGVIHQPPVIVAEEGKVLPPLAPKSLYKIVSEHKDVTKVIVPFNGKKIDCQSSISQVIRALKYRNNMEITLKKNKMSDYFFFAEGSTVIKVVIK